MSITIPIFGIRVTSNFGYHLKTKLGKFFVVFFLFSFALAYRKMYYSMYLQIHFHLLIFFCNLTILIWCLSIEKRANNFIELRIDQWHFFLSLHIYLTQWHFECNKSCLIDTFTSSNIIIPTESEYEFHSLLMNIFNNNNYPSGMRPIL